MRELLRNRRFMYVWGGQSVSAFGDWVRNMALTFWVYDISNHSPVATAAVMVAEYLPMLLLAPLAGVFVDRWSRRRTLFWTQVISAGLSLAFLVALGLRSLPLALVIAFSGSLVSQFYNPARGAIIPVIVERPLLVGANSLGQVTQNLALVLGPMVGTAVYFSLGATWSFGLDSLSFAVSALAVLLAALPDNVPTASRGGLETVVHQWREGLAHIRSNRAFGTVLLAMSIMMLGGGAANVCDLYLVTRNLGLPESSLSVVIAVQGMASVVTALVMATKAKRLDSRVLLWGGLLTLGVGAMGVGLSPTFTWVLIATGVAGIGSAMMAVGQGTIAQITVPADLRGRVFSVTGPVVMTATLLGTATGGLLASHMDVRPIIAASGVLALAGAGAAFLGLREPLQEAAAPHPAGPPHESAIPHEAAAQATEA